MAIGGEVTYVISSEDKEFLQSLTNADNKMRTFGKTSQGVGGFVKDLFTYDMIKGAITGMADLVKETIGYTGALEQSQIAWKTLLGSQEAAEDMQKHLQQLAKKTPFDYAGVDKMAKSLNMAGFEGQDLYDAVISVGDAVSAVGGNTDTATSATRALYQMYSKGKVQAEEMMQLSEAGIPVWQILAKETGKSVAELQEMGSAGELLAEDILPMLIKGMGTEFAGAMEEQSQSFNGLMSTFQDQLGQIGSWLTIPLFEGLKGGLSAVTGWADGVLDIIQAKGASRPEIWNALVEYFKNSMDQLPPVVTETLKGLGTVLGAGLVGGLSFDGVGAFFAGTFSKELAEKGLGKTVIDVLKSSFKDVKAFGSMLMAPFTAIGSKMGMIFAPVLTFFAGIGSKIATFFGPVTAFFAGLGSKIVAFLSPVLTGIKTFASTAGSAFMSIGKVALMALGPGALIAGVLVGLGLLQTTFGDQINSILTMVTEKGPQIVQGFIDGIVSKMPGLMEAGTTLLVNLLSAITANLPTVLSGGVQIVQSLIAGLADNLPQIMTAGLSMITTLVMSLIDSLPQLVSSGMKLIGALANGLVNNLPNIISSIGSILTALVNAVIKYGPRLLSQGADLIVNLASGLIRSIPDVLSAIGRVVSGAIDKAKATDWGAVGKWMIEGLARGISNAIDSVMSAISGVVDSALDWAKEKLGIHSPSKVMADEIGQWLPKGVAVGIDANVGSAIQAISAMNKALQAEALDKVTVASLYPPIDVPVTPYSKDIAEYNQNKNNRESGSSKTIIFNQTNNSPENINAREAARLAKIRLQQLGDLAMT